MFVAELKLSGVYKTVGCRVCVFNIEQQFGNYNILRTRCRLKKCLAI